MSASDGTGRAVAVNSAGYLAAAERRLRWWWFFLIYPFAQFAVILATMMPAVFSAAAKLAVIAPGQKEAQLGVVVSASAITLMAALPVFGALSDRTRLRQGRRKPYLLAGLPIAFVGASLVAAADDFVGMAAGMAVLGLAVASCTIAVVTIVPDHVPQRLRGRVGALGGIATQLAGVCAVLLGGLVVDHGWWLLFLLPVLVLTAAAIPYILFMPDRPADEHDAASTARIRITAEILRYPDFVKFWVARFIVQLGLTSLTTFQLYFLLDRFGMPPSEAGTRLALVGGIGIVAATTSAIVSAVYADRRQRRKPPIVVAFACYALGLATVALAYNIAVFAVGALVVFAGAGMMGANDDALVVETIPPERAAVFMGVYFISTNLPTAVAPLIAPLILLTGNGSNYTALWLSAATAVLVGLLLIIRMRVR